METLQDFVDYADTNIDMDKTVVVLKMFDPTIHDAGCKYLVEYTIGNISDENRKYIDAFSYEIVAIRCHGEVWLYAKTDKKYFYWNASFHKCRYCGKDMIHLDDGVNWVENNVCSLCYHEHFNDVIRRKVLKNKLTSPSFFALYFALGYFGIIIFWLIQKLWR